MLKIKYSAFTVILIAIIGAIVINILASYYRSNSKKGPNSFNPSSISRGSAAVKSPVIVDVSPDISLSEPKIKSTPPLKTPDIPPTKSNISPPKTSIPETPKPVITTPKSAFFSYETLGVQLCSKDVEVKLSEPQLSGESLKWCEDAVDPRKGQVVVGKSWGKLSSRADRDKFEALNCNSASTGKNPSCNDAWGDSHVYNWRKNEVIDKKCPNSKGGVRCHANDLNEKYCVFTNAMIDFSRSHKVSGGREVPKREFHKDYLTIDCDGQGEIPGFELAHLYSSNRDSSKSCDIHISGKTLLYSHDNLRNLCHTWSDWLNVWLLLWLENLAERPHQVNLLTVDSLRRYNDFDDLVNDFFSVYRGFKQVMRGMDFKGKRVCFDELITQSLPTRGFVWENWQQDLPCSFVGPSSLFQRWNLELRKQFQLLDVSHAHTSQRIQVLLIIRSDKRNDWGSYRTSRLITNAEDVVRSLRELSAGDSTQGIPSFDLVVQDMSKIGSLETQFRLLANTSIIVGTHGAGIVHSMHLPLGTKKCCGVLEIFPRGEFTPVRGYANMIRRMGLHYSRLDLSEQNSKPDGAVIPIGQLTSQLTTLLQTVDKKSSCVLQSVVNNPFLH